MSLWYSEMLGISGIRKAWTDYFNLSKEQAPDKKRIMHYERVIHNLQRKLGLPHTMFGVFKMLAFAFYRYNPELFKEGVTEPC